MCINLWLLITQHDVFVITLLHQLFYFPLNVTKEIVHPKTKVGWKFYLPQAIHDVIVSLLKTDFFSPMDPLQWMGAIRMRVQTLIKTCWWVCFLQTHNFELLKMCWCCGLLWYFYQLFGLSFWRHPFTAEDPLVIKWCNAVFLQIWWRNKLLFDGLRVSKFTTNFHCWVNYSFIFYFFLIVPFIL